MQPNLPGLNGPLFVSAIFCQHILAEQDGVNSAIRLIDYFKIQIPDVPPDKEIRFTSAEAWLLVVFKTEQRERFEVSVRVNPPEGEAIANPLPVPPYWVDLEEEGSSHSLSVKVVLSPRVPGIWWFDVLVNGELASRAGIRVIHERAGQGKSTDAIGSRPQPPEQPDPQK